MDLLFEWQTQDLKCSKCGCLKVSDFMEHCSCSGTWAASLDRKEIEKKLRVLGERGQVPQAAIVGKHCRRCTGKVLMCLFEYLFMY